MLYTLQNRHLRVALTGFGARLVSIEAPDRDGRFGHVLLGFDDPDRYRSAGGAFGAVLGRYANRIADAGFMLDGKAHLLRPNDHGSILHGGAGGFGNQCWEAEFLSEGETPQITFALVSVDGEEGFPGTLQARATYRLAGDTLYLELAASTDAPTVVNLSSHPYFNLHDAAAADILEHEFTILADHYLPTDARQIPTGDLAPVSGTAFDFRVPARLAERIRLADPQLLLAHGFDHCFVLNKAAPEQAEFAAGVWCPATGRVLEIFTTQPGLQFYSGNNLTGAIAGRGGIALRQSAGFAMEAQNFPNAPNQPNFPSAVLRPGEEYRHLIAYRFTLSDRHT